MFEVSEAYDAMMGGFIGNWRRCLSNSPVSKMAMRCLPSDGHRTFVNVGKVARAAKIVGIDPSEGFIQAARN